MAQKYEKLVQEDLNVGTGMTWIKAPGGGELRSTQIGLHSVARAQKKYTASWSPGSIAAGSKASTTVTVPDALSYDLVLASYDKMLTKDLMLSAHVSADDTVTCVLRNPTTSAIDAGTSGTVSVLVFEFDKPQLNYKLLVTPNGSSGCLWDDKAGYPGWGFTQNTITADEAFVRAALKWLTGKSGGMNVLLFKVSTEDYFGSFFQSFITRTDAPTQTYNGHGPWTCSTGLGGTVTVTNVAPSAATWTAHDWQGFNPTIYDLVILPTAPNASNYLAVDNYLLGGGAVWGTITYNQTEWSRYGFTTGSDYQTHAAPDYLSAAFTCALLGSSTYQYGIYSSRYVDKGTFTGRGTSATYPNNTTNDLLGCWYL